MHWVSVEWTADLVNKHVKVKFVNPQRAELSINISMEFSETYECEPLENDFSLLFGMTYSQTLNVISPGTLN